jgi:hypothetical protein
VLQHVWYGKVWEYGCYKSMEDIEDLIYVLEAYTSSAILHL